MAKGVSLKKCLQAIEKAANYTVKGGKCKNIFLLISLKQINK